jgi:hypothetical protein
VHDIDRLYPSNHLKDTLMTSMKQVSWMKTIATYMLYMAMWMKFDLVENGIFHLWTQFNQLVNFIHVVEFHPCGAFNHLFTCILCNFIHIVEFIDIIFSMWYGSFFSSISFRV